MAEQQRRNRFPSLAGLLRLRRETIAANPRRYVKMLLVCLVVLLVVDAVAGWPFLVARLQAVAVLDKVGGQSVPALVRWLAVEPVKATELTLTLPSGVERARMYTPVNHPDAPGMVVVHGVHYLGMDEPRLEAFASAMAGCGLRVLTPELPDIKDYHIGASSIASIGDTAAWMAHESGDKPVGVMGLSFSGSLSLLAAAAPQYRRDIKFVVAVGSEGEMLRVANYYLTGKALRPSGDAEVLAPHEYGALVLEYESLQDFVPAPDRDAVRLVLRDHLYEDFAAERAALAKLTPGQLAEAKQLMDTTSAATRKMIEESDERHLAEMASVSPDGQLAQLETPVFLLHGEGDNIIPSAETQWLEKDVPKEMMQASLISPVISHLDLDGKGPGFADQWRLVHFFAQVLHAAEAR
ncbi:S9 family peptidase [Granulicella sp. L46]|uniref:alpha/beta hydrolase family protein n=1 Tax=Granulicella sp. L46 TaxID=1641865 RepID=UPI00131E097D|nr:alpha/beta hydrolase [Granulicella sp. L46]